MIVALVPWCAEESYACKHTIKSSAISWDGDAIPPFIISNIVMIFSLSISSVSPSVNWGLMNIHYIINEYH